MAHRLAAAALLLLATGLVGAGAARLRYDNSYRIWFVEGDPALVAYDDFLERFGSDEAVVLAVDTAGEPFSEATLRVVSDLSAAVAGLPGVLDVWSLTHMEAFVDTGGALEVRRLVEVLPPPPETVARVRRLVDGSPLYRRLVAEDGRTTAIVATTEHTDGSFEPTAKLVRGVREAVAAHAGGGTVLAAGGPVMDEAMFRYSERDSLTYLPITLLVMTLALAWLFRSLIAVVLPLGVVLLSIVWAVGFMGWMRWDANVLTTILPGVLGAVGIADAVHLLQHFRLAAGRGAPPERALRSAFVDVFRPCLLTSVTTAGGMASLVVASLQGMRELGLAAAVGVLAAFVMTMAGVPILLSVLPTRRLADPGRARTPRWLARLARLAIHRPGRIAFGAAVVFVAAGVGITRIDTGSSMVSYFYEDDVVYREALAVDRAFGGAFPLEILVEARGDSDLIEPDALARIDAIAAYLTTVPATGAALSGLDFLKEARRVLLGEPPGRLARPATRQEAAQILLLLEGEGDTGRFLADDHRAARVEVAVAATRYEEVVGAHAEIESRLAELCGEKMSAHMTGLARLLGGMEEYLFRSQVRSFGLAFVLVTLFIALLFRSARAGLLAAIPNLLPLVLVLGLMGWAHITLDATTSMIAPLLLGIVVDDTVHVMERVLAAPPARGPRAAAGTFGGAGETVPRAFTLAVEEVGTAIAVTTVVLCAGFLVLVLGSFRPNFYFAVLSALALVLALAADLVVLPAVGCLLPRLVPRGGRNSPR